MAKTIKRYCKKCITCERIKDRTVPRYGMNSPLPVPSQPWEYISMDFITNLPEINGNDAIITFVDLFTKQAHFIPCNIKITAQQLARIYIKEIYRLHGLSRVIICDRDPRFTSVFWKNMFSQLQTKLNISSSYHPQTDGQTERTHRTIEQILRAFVYKQHNQWYDFLPLAEFSYNNSRHTSTTFSPFEAIYGFKPISPPLLATNKLQNSNEWFPRINEIHDLIVEQLKIAKTLQSHYKNRTHIDHQFKVGDKVMIETNHLTIRNQPTRKLRQRFIGPYPITKVISLVACEIFLPGTLRIHPVFHISKLIATNIPEAPIGITPTSQDTTEEYQVDSILDFKTDILPSQYRKGPCLLFKVRWSLPYTSQYDSWEPLVLLC